jgi:crotonobetainyl-CoA:carnitine CoA-transferase CaiB-like acyl-CoA transferase
VDHHELIRDVIRGWVSGRSVDEVVSTLNSNGVPSCPIYDLKQASEDPHIGGARRMTVERRQPGLGEVTLLGNPIKMSATDPAPRGPAPELGGDTDSVLKSLLGLSRKEIDGLRKKGAL